MPIENNKEINRAIALSALVQAANLVDRLASHGNIPQSSFELMRSSLFQFKAENIEDIYQTLNPNEQTNSDIITSQVLQQNLHIGLRICQKIFKDSASQEYPQTIRYAMDLIQLEKHFQKSLAMQERVKNKLIELSSNENNSTSKELNQSISELYLESLATLPFRIQVLGKMQHLQNTENEHQVRVLLFSGIRAAMLWQQYGGRRWQFLLSKNAIIRGLDSIKKPVS